MGLLCSHGPGLIEILAAVRDHNRASWNTWPLCMCALIVILILVRDHTGASLKSWPLGGIAMRPL